MKWKVNQKMGEWNDPAGKWTHMTVHVQRAVAAISPSRNQHLMKRKSFTAFALSSAKYLQFVKIDPVMMLSTSITTTSRMFPVFSL